MRSVAGCSSSRGEEAVFVGEETGPGPEVEVKMALAVAAAQLLELFPVKGPKRLLVTREAPGFAFD